MTLPDYAEAKESVVFCEGFHDRDFWAGWLPRLGWTDPGMDTRTGTRTSFKDPFGKPVAGGQFGFAKDRRFVRIQQIWEDTAVSSQLGSRLRAIGAWNVAEAL